MANDEGVDDDARAKAEARRKRILEKANKRMGVVSGEQALGEDEKKQSTSNAARIRAARQRRYGKKPQQEIQKTITEADSSEGKAEEMDEKDAGALVAEELKDATGEKDPNDLSVTAESDVAENTAFANKETVKPVQELPKENESVQEIPKVSDDEPKKLYLGVARMRRKMIMKKKAAEEQASNSIEPMEILASKKDGEVNLTVEKAKAVPILMYAITIIILFASGFDFGLQQYHGQMEIHEKLAVQMNLPFFGSLSHSNSGIGGLSHLQTDFDQDAGIDYNEFQEDFSLEEGEMDPLFGVDLDELTKGPGLIFVLARWAVSVHRFFLSIFYYGPSALIQTIVGIPTTLLQMPPILFFIALFVRQVIGKTILNAEIPSPENKDNDQGIDVLSMVKSGVSSFLASTFPFAAGLYQTFVHMRTDIYIVIFGAMCGILCANLMNEYGGENIAIQEMDGAATEL